MAISFQAIDIGFRITGRVKLKSWIRRILKNEGKKEGEITIVFTNDDKVHQMNLEYLSHDTLTDIITFDQSEGLTVAGDIVISKERVDENAALYKVSQAEELRRVIIHGVLHLCGYKDKTPKDQKVMRAREDEALAIFSQMKDIRSKVRRRSRKSES